MTIEVPSDDKVQEVLLQNGPLTAVELLSKLVDAGYGRKESRRAIRRCLDRGVIILGRDLQLEALNNITQAA